MKKLLITGALGLVVFAVVAAGNGPYPGGGGGGSGGTTTTNLAGGNGINITVTGVTNIVSINTNIVVSRNEFGSMAFRGTNDFIVPTTTFVISPNPPPVGANAPTNWFGPWTPGTKTSGFQELINSIQFGTKSTPGGGSIFVMPGLYYIGDCITNQIKQGTYELSITGSGKLASVLLQTNSIPTPVIRFNAAGSSNYLNFNLREVGIMSVTNACTNLVEVLGFQPVADFTIRGNIGGGEIKNNLFDCWLYATNTGQTGLATGIAARSGTKNLCPIYYCANFSSLFSIEDNNFNNCAGVVLAADNWSFWHNDIFSFGGPNDWPATDPRSSGCGVIVSDPPFISNTLNAIRIGYNHFVRSNGRAYLFAQSSARKSFPIIGDRYEGGSSPVTLRTGYYATLYEAFGDSANALTNNYICDSTTDYKSDSSYSSAPQGVVKIFDSMTGLSVFTFNATNSANVFGGDGGLLTNLNASQLTSGTIPNARLSSAVITNGQSGVTLNDVTLTDVHGLGTMALADTNDYVHVSSQVVIITNTPTDGDTVVATGPNWKSQAPSGSSSSSPITFFSGGISSSLNIPSGTYYVSPFGASATVNTDDRNKAAIVGKGWVTNFYVTVYENTTQPVGTNYSVGFNINTIAGSSPGVEKFHLNFLGEGINEQCRVISSGTNSFFWPGGTNTLATVSIINTNGSILTYSALINWSCQLIPVP